MKRNEGEGYLPFVERATQSLSDGFITFAEWSQAVLGEELYSEENLRRCSVFFNKFLKRLEDNEMESIEDKDKIAEIYKAKEELIKERKKLQNENLIFSHGETRDLQELIEYLENLYDVSIDACYGAHFHSESSKSIGVGNVGSKRIIRVPSICGTDTYARSILKHNRAGAYFAIFDEDGENLNKIYFLN